MKTEIFFVKSLELYLKSVVSLILRNPQSLKSGRAYTNIKLRPREVLGAFLICAVVRHISSQDWTITRDPEIGDGMIWCRDSRRKDEVALLEQVYVRLRPKGYTAEKIVTEINRAISKKVNKGRNYAKNRHLIIFLDVEGPLDHQKVKKLLDGIGERFDSYWLFAPYDKHGQLIYAVFLLKAENDQSSVYRVSIFPDFSGWSVVKLGTL